MKRRLPETVLKAPPHALVLVVGDAAVELYVREDEFGLASYPQHCTLEFMLPVWDDGRILCVALLLRLAGRNASTFDRWVNPADPEGLRLLQALSSQKMLDVRLVSDRLVRLLRTRNGLAGKAAGLVASLRLRRSWEPAEFDAVRRRLDTLYPTSGALWRAAREMER